MFQDEAPYLKEWVEYHRMIGVDHFWLYDNDSQDEWEEVLSPYIKEGLVEVFPWGGRENTHYYPVHLQIEALKDALYKAKGKVAWLAFIDIDEFFLPKKEKTLLKCLEKHYSQADAVFVSWRHFGTRGVFIPKGEPIIHRLTASCKKLHPKDGNGKSIWRPESVDVDNIFWVHSAPLKAGSIYLGGSGDPADDSRFQGNYLQLNHYFLRDENFFWDRRILFSRTGRGPYSETDLMNIREDFSNKKNYSMVRFLEKKHPKMYRKFWNKKSKKSEALRSESSQVDEYLEIPEDIDLDD
jgi:hypothetical protein